jgi:aspartyl aminopeptidase
MHSARELMGAEDPAMYAAALAAFLAPPDGQAAVTE